MLPGNSCPSNSAIKILCQRYILRKWFIVIKYRKNSFVNGKIHCFIPVSHSESIIVFDENRMKCFENCLQLEICANYYTFNHIFGMFGVRGIFRRRVECVYQIFSKLNTLYMYRYKFLNKYLKTSIPGN